MDLQDFIEPEENGIAHLANKLSSFSVSRKTTSQASSKERVFPSQRLESASRVVTTFLARKQRPFSALLAGDDRFAQ